MTTRTTGSLADPAGRVLVRFVPTERDGRPMADFAVAEPGASPQEAASALLGTYAGGRVATEQDALANALQALGAQQTRASTVMSRDLRADPPLTPWDDETFPRLISAAVDPTRGEELIALWARTNRPEHVDYDPRPVVEILTHELQPLLDGVDVGALLPASAMLLDGGRIVACCLINDSAGDPPAGGPWVGDIFRDPDVHYAGTGAWLLRRAMVTLVRERRTTLGLAVTVGNPAQRVYQRLGFRELLHSRTLLLPVR